MSGGGWAMPQQQPKRHVGVLAAGAGVVALVVALLTVVALRGGGNDGKAPALPESRNGAVETPGSAAPSLTRENVRWMDLEGLRLPTADGLGPANRDGGRSLGFAQAPGGAVLAAIHITYRSAGPEFGPKVFRPTIAEQVVGADKALLLATVEKEYAAARSGGLTPSGAPLANLTRIKAAGSQVIAYRVDSFSADQAVLQLLGELRSAAGERVLVNSSAIMRWVDGDWRLTAPLNGDPRNGANRVPAVPAGYTVFAG